LCNHEEGDQSSDEEEESTDQKPRSWPYGPIVFSEWNDRKLIEISTIISPSTTNISHNNEFFTQLYQKILL
jgi:hypothetical protein